MKTYEQLTEQQKKKAVERATSELLRDILEGAMRFNDEQNNDDLQARIDAACAQAEKNRTPWFAHEFIMEDSYAAQAIRGMAQCAAEDSLYTEPSEHTVAGIVTEEGGHYPHGEAIAKAERGAL